MGAILWAVIWLLIGWIVLPQSERVAKARAWVWEKAKSAYAWVQGKLSGSASG
jgi:hypothetical protein